MTAAPDPSRAPSGPDSEPTSILALLPQWARTQLTQERLACMNAIVDAAAEARRAAFEEAADKCVWHAGRLILAQRPPGEVEAARECSIFIRALAVGTHVRRTEGE